jgi:alkyl hydroperoxide reductase subunit F
VDTECRTGVSGVFACGDVTNVPYKQVVVAAGEGAKAALSAYSYLLNQR